MSETSYTATFTVDRTPDAAYIAVLNPRGWWSPKVTGESAHLGDVFHFGDAGIGSSSFRLVEAEPPRRVAWRIDEAFLTFVEDHEEWTGTRIVFEIAPNGSGAAVRFTHEGLLPAVECYRDCSRGWGMCMDSLKELIERSPAGS
ncbi:MAG TPA: SRPBCC domain-containing protein [Mycobacteriales bacterium]|nr:SRPBCC domain-containing protein [Mycobacteriales bacterium]